MKIVIAPDSFKGSLTATEAASAMERGVLSVLPNAEIVRLPVADGGEGTLDAVLTAAGGNRINVIVQGPFGQPIPSAFGLLPGGEIAVVEMALAAGLGLVPEILRDPRFTSTYGVGELIASAANTSARTAIVAIGGSCTNDGGAGAMQALGGRFYDLEGQLLTNALRGADLAKIGRVDISNLDFPNNAVGLVVASDVKNPLLGPRGATLVYSPQKGATPEIVAELEAGMGNLVMVVRRDLDIDMASPSGAGAAGGLGAALIAFLRAEMRSGIDLILDLLRFDELICGASMVLTGEGKIDAQTLQGKVVAGVVRRCVPMNIPVHAFAGVVEESASAALAELGLSSSVQISQAGMPKAEAIAQSSELLERAVGATLRSRFAE
jgi:glycerate kinase